MTTQEGHWVLVESDSGVCRIPSPPSQTTSVATAASPVIPLLLLLGVGVAIVLMARG